MHWWWNYIDGRDLYRHFHALARFSAGIDRIADDYRQVWVSVRCPGNVLTGSGMQAAEKGFYWICRRDSFTARGGLPLVNGAEMFVSGLTPGEYVAEFWDTVSGEITATATAKCDGRLRIQLPPVNIDIAVKLRRSSPLDAAGVPPYNGSPL
jgi:hypothetical protein